MIARDDRTAGGTDIWGRLAETLDPSKVQWRQDGKASARDGKFFARFVCYVEANDVRERLDTVVPGEWDLTLELLPPLPSEDENGNSCSFKARLQILGVIREDVGTGRDYKAAATDAFKRAAVRFGIAHELYSYEQNWVQVDSDSRFPKPLEDPGQAYARRYGAKQNGNGNGSGEQRQSPTPAPARTETRSTASGSGTARETTRRSTPASAPATTGTTETNGTTDEVPSCPKCGGRVWDNRVGKRNAKAPDFKCRDRSCDGVIWPAGSGNRKQKQAISQGPEIPGIDDDPPDDLDSSPLGMDINDIPF